METIVIYTLIAFAAIIVLTLTAVCLISWYDHNEENRPW